MKLEIEMDEILCRDTFGIACLTKFLDMEFAPKYKNMFSRFHNLPEEAQIYFSELDTEERELVWYIAFSDELWACWMDRDMIIRCGETYVGNTDYKVDYGWDWRTGEKVSPKFSDKIQDIFDGGEDIS